MFIYYVLNSRDIDFGYLLCNVTNDYNGCCLAPSQANKQIASLKSKNPCLEFNAEEEKKYRQNSHFNTMNNPLCRL